MAAESLPLVKKDPLRRSRPLLDGLEQATNLEG